MDALAERLAEKYERGRFSVASRVFRLKTRLNGDARPSSAPFISGDGFRALARHKFDSIGDVESAANRLLDSNTSFNVKRGNAVPDFNKGDVVFVASSVIEDFFEKVHPKISNPYILITHNGDTNIDEGFSKLIDEKIIRWFAQNVLVSHPKLTPIPIGLENLHYYQNGVTSMYRRLRRKIAAAGDSFRRKARIFYHFKVRTNPEKRQPASDYFSRNGLAETIAHKLPQYLYLKRLSSYMFVASPPGNGEDCHRTWESLYLGAVPIVKDSAAMRSFATLGLPLWIVRDWHELDGLTERDLEQRYAILMRTADRKALYMGYWDARIMDARNASKRT